MIEGIRKALAGYRPQRLSGQGLVPAAVLIPLYERDGQLHILFTRRTQEVEHHKGQISFPGGASDALDPDPLTTALRETREEIGLDPRDVEVLGQLDDFITITGFLVTPFVGLIRTSPYPFVLNRREVAAILEVPLAHLLDRANLRWERRQREGVEVLMPVYQWGEEVIWGATARILHRFLSLLMEEGP